jgi:plastocyanin
MNKVVASAIGVVLAITLAGALGIGIGWGIGTTVPKSSASGIGSSTGQTSSGSVYRLQLIEPMNTGWNSTTAQPKFFVVGSKGLESSADISLPLNTLIQVMIVSYDTPTPGSTNIMGVVNGTQGNKVYLINGTTASMSSMPEQWGQNVTSVPGAQLAHTFTIQGLGVNIPVVGGDTEIAYLYLTKAGTYTWYCQTPCGFGMNGMGGAMSANGWMTGSVTVS